MLWTILSNGTEKALANWGLENVRRSLISQGIDTLSFRASAQAVDSPPLFAYAHALTLFRDRSQSSDGSFSGGQIWFAGIVTQIPAVGSPNAERMDYVVSGPWWYLEHRLFQQAYRIITHYTTDSPPVPVYDDTQSSTHLFLNIAPINFATPNPPPFADMLNTGQQILEALNWALKPFVDASALPPFQIGTITPNTFVPHDEVRDITCAEVIHKELRWHPDAVTWFDYTTTPPTFNCARRADLAAPINLDMSQT